MVGFTFVLLGIRLGMGVDVEGFILQMFSVSVCDQRKFINTLCSSILI